MKQPPDQDVSDHHGHRMRDDAEDHLNKPDCTLADLSGKTSGEIIHELRVHQIELDMQNEELKRFHQELEISKDRYIALYDLVPFGYFTLTDEAVIVEVNLTAATMLGINRQDLIHARFRKFVTAIDQDHWDRFFLLYSNMKRVKFVNCRSIGEILRCSLGELKAFWK